MRVISLILLMEIFLSLAVSAEGSLGVEEVIRSIFPSFQEYNVESHILENQELKVFTILSGGRILGWTLVLDEMGKIKPITFLVGVDIQGKVLAVYVLEYRDMFGSEIKRRSFLRQFQSKTLKDSLAVGRDIDAVTGATISSHAATLAVKKSLEVIEKMCKLIK